MIINIMILIIILVYLILIIYLFFYKEYDNFKVLVSDINTQVEIINENNFSNYKNELDNLYKNCVYNNNNTETKFNLQNKKSIVFILKNNNKIIGSLQIDDFDNLNKSLYLKKGAINNKKGLFLTYLCGDDNYKGITKPLFDSVYNYAKNNDYQYILLEAITDWRQKYYNKFGFYKIDSIQKSMIKYI
jgi:hypothetical protein